MEGQNSSPLKPTVPDSIAYCHDLLVSHLNQLERLVGKEKFDRFNSHTLDAIAQQWGLTLRDIVEWGLPYPPELVKLLDFMEDFAAGVSVAFWSGTEAYLDIDHLNGDTEAIEQILSIISDDTAYYAYEDSVEEWVVEDTEGDWHDEGGLYTQYRVHIILKAADPSGL